MLVLGIILAALFASICVVNFGFALIATKVAIALIALSATFSIVSFVTYFCFHMKTKKAQELSYFDNSYTYDSNNINQQNDNITKDNNYSSAYTTYMQQNQDNVPVTENDPNPYGITPSNSHFNSTPTIF